MKMTSAFTIWCQHMSESWDKGHGCRCLASTLLLTTLCKHFISQNVWLTGLSGQFSSWTFLKYLAVKWAECSLGLPWWSRQNLKTLKNLIWMAEYVAVYRSPLKVPSQICANAPQNVLFFVDSVRQTLRPVGNEAPLARKKCVFPDWLGSGCERLLAISRWH